MRWVVNIVWKWWGGLIFMSSLSDMYSAGDIMYVSTGVKCTQSSLHSLSYCKHAGNLLFAVLQHVQILLRRLTWHCRESGDPFRSSRSLGLASERERERCSCRVGDGHWLFLHQLNFWSRGGGRSLSSAGRESGAMGWRWGRLCEGGNIGLGLPRKIAGFSRRAHALFQWRIHSVHS